jgi:hypothetical protein
MGRMDRMGREKTGHRFTPTNTDQEHRIEIAGNCAVRKGLLTWMNRMGRM